MIDPHLKRKWNAVINPFEGGIAFVCGGVRCIANPALKTTKIEPRTWKERLWSLTPWRSTKRTHVPDLTVYKLPNYILLMHPIVAEKIKKIAPKQTSDNINTNMEVFINAITGNDEENSNE